MIAIRRTKRRKSIDRIRRYGALYLSRLLRHMSGPTWDPADEKILVFIVDREIDCISDLGEALH
jgi:hypothetical protein